MITRTSFPRRREPSQPAVIWLQQLHSVLPQGHHQLMDIWPAIYILASARNGTLYVGVTSSIEDRISIHKQDLLQGFTRKYGVHTLVYFEFHETMDDAIKREKRLKK